MKDYLIRINRRKKNNPRILVGMVEEVGVAGSRAFSNLDELWSILNSSRAETTKTKKRNKIPPPRPPLAKGGMGGFDRKQGGTLNGTYEKGYSEISTMSFPIGGNISKGTRDFGLISACHKLRFL